MNHRMPVVRELNRLLPQPEFDPAITGTHITYRRAQSIARTLGPATHLTPARLRAGLEWATAWPGAATILLAHYAAATTITECGHHNPDLDPLLADLTDATALAVLAAPELGHDGTAAGIHTEATWNPTRDTFTLHTPDPAATKMVPEAGWRGLDRVAVVNAVLADHGQNRGIHAFAIRLSRRVEQGVDVTPLPGDYAALRFDNTEIPRGWWLADDATVTPGGRIRDPRGPVERAARSMHGVRVALITGAALVNLAAITR